MLYSILYYFNQRCEAIRTQVEASFLVKPESHRDAGSAPTFMFLTNQNEKVFKLLEANLKQCFYT
jgi:hypothetical protein